MRRQRAYKYLVWLVLMTASFAATAFAFRNHLTIGAQPEGSVIVPNGYGRYAGTQIES